MSAAGDRRVRRALVVCGLVQGVGFRPWVHALAHERGLSGSVRNTADGVLVEVEGPATEVDAYQHRLATGGPPLAHVESVRATTLEPRGGTGFAILPSDGGPGRTFVSPDVATCADCTRELRDPGDRRHRHPFISCTNCGPRFTIVLGPPYDRATTTMAGFAMCTRCAGEYADPRDRRFHAQPVCCPDCGPQLWLETPGAAPLGGEQALAQARRLLAGGRRRRRQGARRLPPRLRRGRRRRWSGCSASGRTAATSPSRCWCPTSRRRERSAGWTTPRPPPSPATTARSCCSPVVARPPPRRVHGGGARQPRPRADAAADRPPPAAARTAG